MIKFMNLEIMIPPLDKRSWRSRRRRSTCMLKVNFFLVTRYVISGLHEGNVLMMLLVCGDRNHPERGNREICWDCFMMSHCCFSCTLMWSPVGITSSLSFWKALLLSCHRYEPLYLFSIFLVLCERRPDVRILTLVFGFAWLFFTKLSKFLNF